MPDPRSDLRDLPWRRTRDPWAILVAELMLQQTQVPRVIPKYEAFLTAFPTVASCAQSPVAEVVRHWAGLGYNRRAVFLQACAVQVMERHEGRVPDDLDALLSLRGIGPYTARAVLAFAFERDVAVVDTNVARILARVAGVQLTRGEVQQHADALVPAGRGWHWNQAMLDLGATRCRPGLPECSGCPFEDACAWHCNSHPEPDPAIGSAGVSGGQSRFAGSDRQGRGRLIDALRTAPVPASDLPRVMGWPSDLERATRIAEGILADGLAHRDSAGTWHLG